ncbi:MAG TPA: carbamoyltransferase HypF [Clostridia bacterium]
MSAKKRYVIRIKGIVQGVGFRPFVFRLALDLKLSGFVLNNADGVLIEAEGNRDVLDTFVDSLKSHAPKMAFIEELKFDESELFGYHEFEIRKSEESDQHEAYISPDIAICDECLSEISSKDERRYMYSFTNCTNCGPRFTITQDIPYDRKNTTMNSFHMCEMCKKEYNDIYDRRFHAQPMACPECGPHLLLVDKEGNRVHENDEIAAARKLLKDGSIIAIKGLGGYHLSCDALNHTAVDTLRLRKRRDGKPFALMADRVDTVLKYCNAEKKEIELLESPKRPVVLLERKPGQTILPESLASDNNRLGVMLPYTPLHYLLFDDKLQLLVMTSGNISGEPIYYKDKEAFSGLRGIADYFLSHDREIYIRTDDSVTSAVDGREYIIRRSRGYVPYPLDISHINETPWGLPDILACGGELKNTFCIVKKGKAFLSHHIGDLENLETLVSYEQGIEHFKRIFSANIGTVAYDMHPEYLSTKYALGLSGLITIPVQHHHAHIASCMAENRVDGPVIGIAFDGTGYGDDGSIWGGEFFTGSLDGFTREAHLSYVKMPGGDKCIKEPWRMALSYIYESMGGNIDIYDTLKEIEKDKIDIVLMQIEKGINTVNTSSMGRLFDAVSSITGLCLDISYEGQAAIRLEKEADTTNANVYPYTLETSHDGHIIINTSEIIKSVVRDTINKKPVSYIAGCFHITISDISLNVCRILRNKMGINDVALSGGVFQNRLLLRLVMSSLREDGFNVYIHSRVPSNDGGISLGQAAIAAKTLKER